MGRGLAIWAAIILLAGAALAWNAARFVGTSVKPRTKELTFLPPPVVAQALSLGQGTAAAKLRWIDSFSYFSLMVDRQDDRVAGDGRGGMERLYDTLIALDPLFIPFYEHAVLNTGGVLKDHRAALGFVQRGLTARSGETSLWRLGAAELAISFDWTKRFPALLDGWLRAWSAAEPEENRQTVLDWRRGLAFSSVDGLETLPYWREQLRTCQPRTPLADFVEGTVREVLATHAEHILPKLLATSLAMEVTGTLRLDPARVAATYPRGFQDWMPVEAGPDGPRLRCDPFGYPFRRDAGGVHSPGLEHRKFLTATTLQRRALEDKANSQGRPPADAAEAAAWGIKLPDPPDGGRWDFSAPAPEVRWADPPQEPWNLR